MCEDDRQKLIEHLNKLKEDLDKLEVKHGIIINKDDKEMFDKIKREVKKPDDDVSTITDPDFNEDDQPNSQLSITPTIPPIINGEHSLHKGEEEEEEEEEVGGIRRGGGTGRTEEEEDGFCG